MSSPKFELVKKRNPGLAPLLDRMAAYVREQIRAGEKFIVPKLGAAKLGLNDGEAFVLLELLTKGEVLRRVYNVYCRRNDMLLATVDSIEALGDIPHCDYCDADHDISGLKVEVAFVPNDDELRNMAA